MILNILDNILGALQVGGALLLSPLIRPWYNRWGATTEQLSSPLPGDELVPQPLMGYTRAVTIDAPVDRVWPWLAQLGQGRGGLYSYDGLENLIGCRIHSLDHLDPALQNLQVGDLIPMGPPGYPCYFVAALQPPQYLVLLSVDPRTRQPVKPESAPEKGHSLATWQFCLQSLPGGDTQLLCRQRLAYTPDMAWIWRLTEPFAFVMERKMLLGIRQRAGRLHTAELEN